jgi:hypothetical protein
MNLKTDQIRAAWASGDQIRALRIAARFFDRSTDTKTFKRGMDAVAVATTPPPAQTTSPCLWRTCTPRLQSRQQCLRTKCACRPPYHSAASADEVIE